MEGTKESRAVRRNSGVIDGGVLRDLEEEGDQTHLRHCSPFDVKFGKRVKKNVPSER